MRINGQVVVKLDSLGINMDNFHIIKEVATNSEWDARGYNEIVFHAEYADDFRNIEKDIENIKLMTNFKEAI